MSSAAPSGAPASGLAATTSSGFPGYRKGVRVEISREDAAAAARENASLIVDARGVYREPAEHVIRA